MKILKHNLDKMTLLLESMDQKSYRIMVLLVAYFILLFINPYKIGVEILIAFIALSFIDLKKIKNYNFVEKLFEDDDIEQAEKKIKGMYRSLDAVGIGIYEWNFEEEKFYWSDLSAKILGQDKDKVPKKLDEFWSLIYEKDQNCVKEAFNRALINREPFFVDFKVARADGSFIEVNLRGKIIFNSTGSPAVFTGSLIEGRVRQNALLQTEAHFKEVTDSVPQLIWVARADGRMEYFNQRWIEYTGVDVQNSQDLAWEDIVHIDDVEASRSVWQRCLRTGESFEMEYRLKSKTNVYRWFKSLGVAIRDREGRISQWFGTCTDIHELKQIQSQLAETLASRDHFLSLASHELRTPLTALRLQANLLDFSLKNEGSNILTREGLERMAIVTDRQVTRLAKLVDDLLDISRIKLDRFTLDPSTYEINDIIKECIDRMSFAYEEAKVKPPIFKSQERVVGYWDRMRLEQVIQNLLTNALRYGRKSEVEIFLEVSKQSIILSVKDQGIGIADYHINKIFELYYRGVGDDEESGLGLGLYLVKKIVEAHKGQVTVQSELNQGSVFCIELPLDFRQSNLITSSDCLGVN